MTLSVDGTDISEAIQAAAFVGSIVAMLVVGLLVYLMVRPPRQVRERRKAEPRHAELEPAEAEELWRLVERMEARLEVLERALADQIERPAIGGRGTERTLTSVEGGRNFEGKE